MVDVAGGNALYYYHYDGLGSVVALSDVNGSIVEKYTYDAFGNTTIHGPDVNGTWGDSDDRDVSYAKIHLTAKSGDLLG